MTRVAAQLTGLHSARIRDKRLTDEERALVARAIGLLQGREAVRVAEAPPAWTTCAGTSGNAGPP